MHKEKGTERFSILENAESALINNLRQHAVFRKINQVSQENFLKILIQRMFLSVAITPVYDLATIASYGQDETIDVIRDILYEEYPRDARNKPLASHREHLIHDLLALGATIDTIKSTEISAVTEETIRSLLRMSFSRNQLAVVAYVRFGSEVLVAEEYSALWPRMEDKLSKIGEDGKPRSLFYWFHMDHDKKKRPLDDNSILDSNNHAERLADCLKTLIKTENDIKFCIKIQEEAQKMKLKFYDQFLCLLQ